MSFGKSSMRSESTSFHQSAFAGASGAMKNRVAHKDPFITSAGGTKSYVYDTCQASADAKKREARRAIKELNEARKIVVQRAFKKLDRDGSGEITIEDVRPLACSSFLACSFSPALYFSPALSRLFFLSRLLFLACSSPPRGGLVPSRPPCTRRAVRAASPVTEYPLTVTVNPPACGVHDPTASCNGHPPPFHGREG